MSAWQPLSVKRAAKLAVKKHREAERLFLAEGEPLLREASRNPVHVFEEPQEIKRISSLATPASRIGVFSFVDVSSEDLLQAGVSRTAPTATREETDADSPRVVVLLHGMQDPGNVGTVIRSARAFGARVALSVGCADLYNPKTVRGTMGAIFHVPIAREVESLDFLEAARNNGFSSFAATVEGGESLRNLPKGKLVIVVGSEGSGLPEEVVRACDLRLTIPSEAPSLNAGVAASILLYEAHSRVLT